MRILFIDIDTLRPDHLGCYGYIRNTSPNIDRIASEGVIFTNYYCSDAPCLPSRSALFTGMFGIHSGIVGHGGTAADLRIEGKDRGFRDRCSKNNLASVLKQHGYYTCTVSPFAERHGAWWFYAGFKEIYNPGKCGNEIAEDITPFVIKWLKENGKKDNWFLHVNYWDPHTPYRTPKSFGNPFKNQPLPEWLTEKIIEEHITKYVGPHTALEINMWDDKPLPQYPRHISCIKTMEDLKKHFDGYDCGIAYADMHIGSIISYLKELGIFDDTAIIITSDHGENQGELGIYAEHATADYITCRIPLIIKWPDGLSGIIDEELHYNLDLPPTITELLGISTDHPLWDGKSFASRIKRNEKTGRIYLVLSQCAHVCQRGVRFQDWMYIRTYHDGFHLFPDEMLFNIKKDPHEQNNIAEEKPEICGQALKYLNEWHQGMMKSMPYSYATDPLWTVIQEGGPFHARGKLAEYIERLKITNRQWAIPLLIKRHPYEFKK